MRHAPVVATCGNGAPDLTEPQSSTASQLGYLFAQLTYMTAAMDCLSMIDFCRSFLDTR